jgi:hypothetical protein
MEKSSKKTIPLKKRYTNGPKNLKLTEVKSSHTLGGTGKGIPEEREVNRSRKVCEWEG